MHDLQKMGGVAALIEAATYVVGMGLLFAVLLPAGYGIGNADPIRSVAFLADNQALMYIWNLIIYVVNGLGIIRLKLRLIKKVEQYICVNHK